MTYTRHRVDPAFALHPERQQYHSTEILEQLTKLEDDGAIVVAIGDVDLYIPILTFVFGEAHGPERFGWKVVLHHMIKIFVMPPGEMDIIEATAFRVNTKPALVTRFAGIRVLVEEFVENNFVGPCTANREGIANHAPLWLPEQAEHFSQIVD